MKMNYKKGFLFLSACILLFFFWVLSLSLEENPINASTETPSQSAESLNLQVLANKSVDDLASFFPKQKFINSIAYENPKELDQVINQTIGILKGDSMMVQRFFVKSIFQESIINKKDTLSYNPEKLLHQISVAENFKKYSEFNPTSGIYASAISDIYFQHVSDQLEIAQQKDKSLVNKFNYQYLVQRCQENNYFPNRKESSIDKFLKTFIEQDYFHLVNTTFQKTTILQKFVIAIMLIFMAVGGIQTLKFIKKSITKNV
jgi:hypothetical protein